MSEYICKIHTDLVSGQREKIFVYFIVVLNEQPDATAFYSFGHLKSGREIVPARRCMYVQFANLGSKLTNLVPVIHIDFRRLQEGVQSYRSQTQACWSFCKRVFVKDIDLQCIQTNQLNILIIQTLDPLKLERKKSEQKVILSLLDSY